MGYPQGRPRRQRPALTVVWDYEKRPRLDPQAAAREIARIEASELPGHLKDAFVALVRRDTGAALTWEFVMIGPSHNRAIAQYLRHAARQPAMALQVWSIILDSMRFDTGEVFVTRTALAAEVDAAPADVSRVLGLLTKAGVLRAEREGRGYRYFVNPMVATRLPAGEREAAQAAAGPLLVLMQGGSPGRG